jgi:hypothetical protein
MKSIFRNEPNLPRAELFRELVRIEIDSVKELEGLVRQGTINESSRIDKYKRDLKIEEFESEYEFDNYIDALNDDLLQIVEVEDVCRFLIVVKLKIIVETITKRLLLWTLSNASDEKRNEFLRELSKHKHFIKTIKQMGIIPENITEFNEINELRCLCNAIKHGSIVDNELSGFAVWSSDSGNEIDARKIDLEKYYNSIPKYVFDLSEKVKQYLISIQS